MQTRVLSRNRVQQIFCAAAIGALSLSSAMSRPAHAGISEQEEIKMGQQVSAQAQKEYGPALPYNNPTARRVRIIGMQLAALSDRKSIPYSYTVLKNDKILNAFAAPGGPVFVTTKLVSTTSNDAELAYVIGHETGHIDRRHVVKQLQKQQQLGIFGAIAGAIFGRSGQIAGGVFGQLQNLKYSRADENQADAMGVRFMSRLGYDPRAALTMLAKLGSGGGPEFLSDHPDTKSRIETVRALIEKENLLDVARRAGGPKLSAGIDFGANSGSNNSASNSGGGNVYPDSGGFSSNDNNETSQDARIDLGAPLRTRTSTQNGREIVIAPVEGFANWANATVSTSGAVTRMRRNGTVLTLRRSSGIADLNGSTLKLSVVPIEYNGALYAPLGTLARAVGASAAIENGVVRLQLGSRRGYLPLP